MNNTGKFTRIPPHHVTIRVPWHDSGWKGTVCCEPGANTSCLILGRVASSKNDTAEKEHAGRSLTVISDKEWPPCVDERATFMADFPITLVKRHPYAASSKDTHGHFMPTPFTIPAYTAACVPFRWMLRNNQPDSKEARGLSTQYGIAYDPQREPEMKFDTVWIQEGQNQAAVLDVFFGAIQPNESLCFLYAKKTPLVEDRRRVIVGVGRVTSVGPKTEYQYSDPSNPPMRNYLWERNIAHSIREGWEDGFLFPYQQIVELAQKDDSINPSELAAIVPDTYFDQFSYGSELLTHDGAIAALVTCAATVKKIREKTTDLMPEFILGWIDRELNRLWKARGPYPGLGSALVAFGLEQGTLLAYAIVSAQIAAGKQDSEDPWQLLEEVFADPSVIPGGEALGIGDGYRDKWNGLAPERKQYLKLLARFGLTAEQAKLLWIAANRAQAGISHTDAEILANPYLLFESTRTSAIPVPFDIVDRGLFPEPTLRERFPIEKPSCLSDAIDLRRVRALVVHLLEVAASEGHSLLPLNWVVRRANALALTPPCPIDEDVLGLLLKSLTEAPLNASGASVASAVLHVVSLADGSPAFQVDRLAQAKQLIVSEIEKRIKGVPHSTTKDWRALVNEGLGAMPSSGVPEDEERARAEKAEALRVLVQSRVCVLLGAAGTGKTTLLRMLCNLPEIAAGGVLLLAPTGKARVRLEAQTGQQGKAKTIAQFLNGIERFDPSTQQYHPKPKAPKSSAHKTVIVDECSMLTEEALAALIDGLSGVSRLVLVGDPRQLPPIGAGRPYVDIVRRLAPEHVESRFPRVGPGYAELTVLNRQRGQERIDMSLATWFDGKPAEATADDVWSHLDAGDSQHLKLVSWKNADELQSKLIEELTQELEFQSGKEEEGFGKSLGGSVYEKTGDVYFNTQYKERAGAAASVERWQILSPVRGAEHGVDALNRSVQGKYRSRVKAQATVQPDYKRVVPRPFGPQGILYGDKVINVVNSNRYDVFPGKGPMYLANGDIGIVVGQRKGPYFKDLPWKIQVEFVSQLGTQFGFSSGEFSEDATQPLELAYALTVHKTQGSEFKTTFVILPNPCWLLSRELLYTALTRHSEKLIVFHQGEIRDFRRFGDDTHSEISRRLTNLFVAPSPIEIQVGKEKRFLDEALIHRTLRGEMVRSKSEVIIANLLYTSGIDYTYESELVFADGTKRYPDFTIDDAASGVKYYWEHLGMLGDPSYAARWERKLAGYEALGVLPHEKGGGPAGTLIVTSDDPSGAIDSKQFESIVKNVLSV